ncbi:hypothetical protein ACE6H2_020781 [Prunus campanulata]
MAQWIRRWSTEPEILGSIPSEVDLAQSSAIHRASQDRKIASKFRKKVRVAPGIVKT